MSHQEQIIKIAIAGAGGRMGREVVKLAINEPGFALVAAVDRSWEGTDIGTLVGLEPCGVRVMSDLELALVESGADVLVDFTVPHDVMGNARLALAHGARPVIGTTGLSNENLEELDKLGKARDLGVLVAPNFSIGAILMMKFAAEAAKYMPHVEIVEYHGDQKLDAPSGTALQTAELIAKNRPELRQGNPEEKELLEGARGGLYEGFRIHSVRLPGLFAQQEVIFGGHGQTLKIRHDSYDRAGYMPGVKLAVEQVMDLTGLTFGIDQFL